MSYGKPHCYKTKIDELNREITELKNEAQLSDIAFDAVQEEIERLRKPWVSVEDKLPENDGLYWIKYTFGTSEALYDNDVFWVRGVLAKFPGVTHWMKLPNPPE